MLNCLAQFCFHNSDFSVFRKGERQVFRTEFVKQVNFLAPEYCFISFYVVNYGESKCYEELFCSAELTGTTHTLLIYLSVINILLSVTAFMGNLLILVALGKESPLHPPSKLLLRSLATTDLFVGVVAEPLVVIYWMSVLKQNWNFCRYAQSAVYLAGHVLCSVSLLTLTTIAVERLLALILSLRYAQVVTVKRTYITLTGLWIFSTFNIYIVRPL